MIESLPLEPGSLLKRREDGSFAEFACRAAVLESGAIGGSGGESSRTSSTSNPKISKERRHDEF